MAGHTIPMGSTFHKWVRISRISELNQLRYWCVSSHSEFLLLRSNLAHCILCIGIFMFRPLNTLISIHCINKGLVYAGPYYLSGLILYKCARAHAFVLTVGEVQFCTLYCVFMFYAYFVSRVGTGFYNYLFFLLYRYCTSWELWSKIVKPHQNRDVGCNL